MSIKKINFLPDFSALSAWGHNRTPFLALVDFDGRVAAAPLQGGFEAENTGFFAGRITLGDSALRFKFDFAAHKKAAKFQPQDVISIITPPDNITVKESIRNLQGHLDSGFSYLVNYCTQTEVEANSSFLSLYERSAAPFTLWLENEFMCFSPEAFVTVTGNEISTTPMKGTGYDVAGLLADEKEQAEHATVVDLLRNDLGRVASDIRIDSYRYLTEIPQPGGRILYQTSTRITGTMPAAWRDNIGVWLPQLLPAGSVTGAPKKETVELIRRYESEPRGFFTGVAVLFDGESFYSCVLIRFLDLTAATLKFRSGAGITIYSDPEAEYAEILSKVYFPQ